MSSNQEFCPHCSGMQFCQSESTIANPESRGYHGDDKTVYLKNLAENGCRTAKLRLALTRTTDSPFEASNAQTTTTQPGVNFFFPNPYTFDKPTDPVRKVPLSEFPKEGTHKPQFLIPDLPTGETKKKAEDIVNELLERTIVIDQNGFESREFRSRLYEPIPRNIKRVLAHDINHFIKNFNTALKEVRIEERKRNFYTISEIESALELAIDLTAPSESFFENKSVIMFFFLSKIIVNDGQSKANKLFHEIVLHHFADKYECLPHLENILEWLRSREKYDYSQSIRSKQTIQKQIIQDHNISISVKTLHSISGYFDFDLLGEISNENYSQFKWMMWFLDVIDLNTSKFKRVAKMTLKNLIDFLDELFEYLEPNNVEKIKSKLLWFFEFLAIKKGYDLHQRNKILDHVSDHFDLQFN